MSLKNLEQKEQEKIQKEKEYWNRLAELVNKKDMVSFYEVYIEYLEWVGPNISKGIRTIYGACKETLRILKDEK